MLRVYHRQEDSMESNPNISVQAFSISRNTNFIMCAVQMYQYLIAIVI